MDDDVGGATKEYTVLHLVLYDPSGLPLLLQPTRGREARDEIKLCHVSRCHGNMLAKFGM